MRSITKYAREAFPAGRSSTAIFERLREDVASGKYLPGQFLPTERQLAAEYQVAQYTVHRALKALESDRLIAAEPRQGFRVLSRANDPRQGCPLAFLSWHAEPELPRRDFQTYLLAELKAAAGARAWSLLVLSIADLAPSAVLERLAAARAFGTVLNIPEQAVVNALARARLPVMLLDDSTQDAATDSVMQDGQQGGVLAAQYLASRGCRRIAWFGPLDDNAHTLSRFGGVTAGLLSRGLSLPAERIYATQGAEVARARALLSGRKRPDAVIALWQGHALALKQAADELRLTVGRDFQMVGWCPDECYQSIYLQAFRKGAAPPAITWSVRTMALTAVARMAERRDNPDLPALSIKIPVRLRLTE